jgi:hypothetical protein
MLRSGQLAFWLLWRIFSLLQLKIPKAALFTSADRQVVAVRANRRHEWDKEEPMTSAVMGS